MTYQTRFLLPVPKSQWRAPSLSLPRDQMGNEVIKTYFIAKARIHDGHVVWKGVFEDRDDFDAFLWSIATGRLAYEPDVWRLPTPQWHPDCWDDVTFEFTTQTFLTTTGSNQTYTVPGDWGNSSNSIECVGGGGSGAAGKVLTSSRYCGGGGGGGYGRIENVSYSPGASVTYRVGSGGAAAAGVDGANGSESYFDNTVYTGAPVGGSYGAKGQSGSGGSAGGAGGGGLGTFTFSGGRGGQTTGSSITNAAAGYGGGGAAGFNGNGVAGTDAAKGTSTGTAGGNADAGSGGSGGAGGLGTSTAGGNGTEWTGSYGCGGGGGGAYRITAAAAAVGSAGGNYGGGGGGAASSSNATGTTTSGAGIQGLIVVTYTPGALFSMANINIPILGL